MVLCLRYTINSADFSSRHKERGGTLQIIRICERVPRFGRIEMKAWNLMVWFTLWLLVSALVHVQSVSLPDRPLMNIQMSWNGNYAVYVVDGEYAYASEDSGQTFPKKKTFKKTGEYGVVNDACITDSGSTVVGIRSKGIITTWTLSWASSSSDAVVSVSNSQLSMTSNSDNIGVSDTENGGLSIACSSSGQYRLFTHGPGGVGLSTDSGGNYYYVNDLSRDAQWYSVAMTSDGLLMAAAIYDGTIWISSNYGSYWDSDIGNSLGTAKWTSVTIAGYNTYGGTIYYDSGIFKSTDRTDGLDNDNGANAEILTAVLRDSGKRM